MVVKRVVVTGAASGIGAALCAQLASDHDVIGLDIRGEVTPGVDLCVDLRDAAAIARIADQIDGPVHGLAHIAGLPGTRPAADIYDVNVHAPRRLTEALSDKLSSDASVVLVSSVTADRADPGLAESVLAGAVPDVDGKTAYELSKGAANLQVLRLLPSLHAAGRRINAVAPGTVDTPILADFEASIGADHIARAAAATGGHGDPADIAAVIAFLLSPASRWINGQVIKVDGGLHGLRAARARVEAAA